MNIVVAVNSDWGIGYGGRQTVVIPEDRARFRALTEGGAIIVGRKTFESFSLSPPPHLQYGCGLPNRKNIVLTTSPEYAAYATGNVVTVGSVEEALAEVEDFPTDKVFVIGGGSVYRQFLPLSNEAYVTRIGVAPPSDAFFPDLSGIPGWVEESRSAVNESNGCEYVYEVWKNRRLKGAPHV